MKDTDSGRELNQPESVREFLRSGRQDVYNTHESAILSCRDIKTGLGAGSSPFTNPMSLTLYWIYPSLREAKRCPRGSAGKESSCNAGDTGHAGWISGFGRSPGGGNGNTLSHSCLKNPMERGAWWAAVQRLVKSWTRLSLRETKDMEPESYEIQKESKSQESKEWHFEARPAGVGLGLQVSFHPTRKLWANPTHPPSSPWMAEKGQP